MHLVQCYHYPFPANSWPFCSLYSYSNKYCNPLRLGSPGCESGTGGYLSKLLVTEYTQLSADNLLFCYQVARPNLTPMHCESYIIQTMLVVIFTVRGVYATAYANILICTHKKNPGSGCQIRFL